MNSKHCPRCNQTKLLADFPVNRSRTDGRGGWCRECMREVTREWKANNPEIVRLHAKLYYHNKKLSPTDE